MGGWREGAAGVSGGSVGWMSLSAQRLRHHAVLEMFSAGAGGVQILAKSLNRADFALSGEGREEASAT